jgi:hypothetical protein
MASNSMILHELYFDGIGAGGAPTAALAEAIGRDFGSLERWRTDGDQAKQGADHAVAFAGRFGSGTCNGGIADPRSRSTSRR